MNTLITKFLDILAESRQASANCVIRKQYGHMVKEVRGVI